LNLSHAELLNLYDEVKLWCIVRRKSFIFWSYDDFVHESYVIALEKLMPKYDYTRGPISSFLRSSLWSYVHPKYCADNNVMVNRNWSKEKKSYGKRTFTRPVFQWPDWDFDPASSSTLDPPDIPGFSELEVDDQWFIIMKSRGMTLKQLGVHHGYSESRACQRLRMCKERWEKARG
tara:strand:- start:64 stop:591 length:528 start_codon:yes stop_codon:yes gene_type:complete